MKTCIKILTTAISILLLWWCADPNGSVTLYAGNLTATPRTQVEDDTEVARIWQAFHERMGQPQKRIKSGMNEPIPLRVNHISGIKNKLAGQISRKGINLWQGLSETDRSAVLSHELAHQYLEQSCPGKTWTPLIHETFALWLSGDYARIAQTDIDFAYGHLAAKWLKEHVWERPSQGHLDLSKMSYAIARLMTEKALPKSPLSKSLNALALTCAAESSSTKELHERILSSLTGVEKAARPKKEPPDLLVLDGTSLEPITERGRLREAYPPGSILKPILIALVPLLRVPTAEHSNSYWQCSQSKQILNPSIANNSEDIWTWEQALTHSCNGFFLNHHQLANVNFKPWIELLNQFGVKHPFTQHDLSDYKKIMQVSLGLLPGILITPYQVGAMYRWLYDASPDIAYALKGTLIDGTLKGAAQKEWLIQHNYGIKTGTLRNISSEPEHGWAVAIGPLDKNSETLPLIALMHQSGLAPIDFISELTFELKKNPVGTELPASVQILGSTGPDMQFHISCRNQIYRLQELPPHEFLGGLRPKSVRPHTQNSLTGKKKAVYVCYEGPITLTSTFAPHRSYQYFGRIRVDPLSSESGTVDLPVTARRARARIGSTITLETSARHYIKNVLASEYPDGYEATLQALSLAIRFNLSARRHHDRPICDTSHCQIFSAIKNINEFINNKRLSAAADWALSHVPSLSCSSPSTPYIWHPFAKGGQKPWQSIMGNSFIGQALGIPPAIQQILKLPMDIKSPDHMTLSARQPTIKVIHNFGVLTLTCEEFRNQLSLPSCPEQIEGNGEKIHFLGLGEGHGMGLDLTKADLMAASGSSGETIFQTFYTQKSPFCLSARGVTP